MNMHDSLRMEEILQEAGWKNTQAVEQADLVLFNTCSVREKAEHKLRSEVGKLAILKKERPDVLIAVAGCVAQQEGEALLKKLPLLDLVLGPDNIPELPFLLDEQQAGSPPLARTVFDLENPQFLRAQPEPGKAPVSAFVTTMKGCDERCSFCIVPYTRGPERYRPVQEIISEMNALVQAGTKEIILLGQTVDSYRDPHLPAPMSDDPDESQFPALLRLIAKEVPGLLRLRYTSPHPRHATLSLAKAHTDLDILARHIHLPVQSGSNRVLKRMIRRYTREEYIERAQRLKSARVGLTLSTDIIVGFPGETDEDFEQTLSLVKELSFTSVYAFKYSIRPHTPAQKLKGEIPEDVKKERLAQLFALSENQTHEHLRSLTGTTQVVLIEGLSKQEGKSTPKEIVSFQGHTDRNEIVHIKCPIDSSLTGMMVPVHIVEANRYSLQGELAQEILSVLPKTSLPAPSVKKPRSLPILTKESF